jgi:hypothetical protein
MRRSTCLRVGQGRGYRTSGSRTELLCTTGWARASRCYAWAGPGLIRQILNVPCVGRRRRSRCSSFEKIAHATCMAAICCWSVRTCTLRGAATRHLLRRTPWRSALPERLPEAYRRVSTGERSNSRATRVAKAMPNETIDTTCDLLRKNREGAASTAPSRWPAGYGLTTNQTPPTFWPVVSPGFWSLAQ